MYLILFTVYFLVMSSVIFHFVDQRNQLRKQLQRRNRWSVYR